MRERQHTRMRARAQDKLDLYVQRLYVLQQRMRRMPMFTAPVYSKLRPVERDFCEVRPPPEHTRCVVWT